jgi:hypothetical protein
MLPIGLRAQGDHEGQRLARGEKVRLFPTTGQKIQRHCASGAGQPSHEVTGSFDRSHIRSGLVAPHAGFDKRRRGHRQLRLPGQIKAQGMLLKPPLGILNGKDRILFLAPMRRPCCLELLFCHLVILSGEFRALSSGRARGKPVMAFFAKL